MVASAKAGAGGGEGPRAALAWGPASERERRRPSCASASSPCVAQRAKPLSNATEGRVC